MKVDEHKYYDGFLGAINDALAGAWEKFSVGLNKNVNGMKSLSLDSRAQLSTSHTVRMERRKEKRFLLSASTIFMRMTSLTGIRLHISKSDDEPSEHFGSSFK